MGNSWVVPDAPGPHNTDAPRSHHTPPLRGALLHWPGAYVNVGLQGRLLRCTKEQGLSQGVMAGVPEGL